MNLKDRLEHSAGIFHFSALELGLDFSAVNLEKYRKMKEHSPSPNKQNKHILTEKSALDPGSP